MDDYDPHDLAFLSLPWRALPVPPSECSSPSGYLFKLQAASDSCIVLLTDYCRAYFEHLNLRQLQRRVIGEMSVEALAAEVTKGRGRATVEEGSYESLTVGLSVSGGCSIAFNLDPLPWPQSATVLSTHLMRPALGLLSAVLPLVDPVALPNAVDKSARHVQLRPDGLGKVFEHATAGSAMSRWVQASAGANSLPEIRHTGAKQESSATSPSAARQPHGRDVRSPPPQREATLMTVSPRIRGECKARAIMAHDLAPGGARDAIELDATPLDEELEPSTISPKRDQGKAMRMDTNDDDSNATASSGEDGPPLPSTKQPRRPSPLKETPRSPVSAASGRSSEPVVPGAAAPVDPVGAHARPQALARIKDPRKEEEHEDGADKLARRAEALKAMKSGPSRGKKRRF